MPDTNFSILLQIGTFSHGNCIQFCNQLRNSFTILEHLIY